MTISQSSSNQGSRLRFASWGRSWWRAVVCWRQRRRAKADLARLAEAGDYLLRDVGLDPMIVRQDPAAALERIVRRRR
jgi:uncharacterized protein YjiS (DUF1127 family)